MQKLPPRYVQAAQGSYAVVCLSWQASSSNVQNVTADAKLDCACDYLCPPAVQKLNGINSLQGCQNNPVQVSSLDLASFDSVRTFASDFNARNVPLAVLICNAGVMAPPRRLETQDGCESQFQVQCSPLHSKITSQAHSSACFCACCTPPDHACYFCDDLPIHCLC